jgi:hypothetical protein
LTYLKPEAGWDDSKITTRNNATQQEVERVSLVIRPMTNKGSRGYFLHLNVCTEINHTPDFDDPHYLSSPRNPMLATVPTFEARWDEPGRSEVEDGGFFWGESRRFGSRNIPLTSAKQHYRQMVRPQWMQGSMAIVSFNATGWPAAADTVRKSSKTGWPR